MEVDPAQQRDFALGVVQRLVEAGFIAYWAGGCVRDQLLGRIPKDYDVATNAAPDQVRQVFGRRRTHAVGAAFGVITVAGPPGAGHVEVATFRRDVAYSDGRRPDAVEYSSPVEDASRRDFTINGLFFDPLAAQIIDFVGGQADLERGVIRAIGDPAARIAEDKLRMLRAVRFAATFGFELEPETRAAVATRAAELPVVSAERIAQEMRLLLVLPARADAVRLLHEVRLLAVLLPEVLALADAAASPDSPEDDRVAAAREWNVTLATLTALEQPSFSLALAALLRGATDIRAVQQVCRRWKLSNREQQRVVWLYQHQRALVDSPRQPWPTVQRLLIAPGRDELLALHQAVAQATGGSTADLEFCRTWLRRPAEELNPAPLVSGHDLIEHGLAAGASFQVLLERVRDAQLVGDVTTRDEALALASRLATEFARPGSH